MKVGIIGAGAVGSACLLSIIMRGCAREVVLVNRNRKKAQGVVNDVRYGAVLSPPIDVRDGVIPTGASVVILTAGVNEKGGGATDRSAIRSEGSACCRQTLRFFRRSSQKSTKSLPRR